VALIEHPSVLIRDGHFALARLPGWLLIGATAGLLTISAIAARGFSDNGFRLGSEFAWRFTCLIYFGAVTAGPLERLFPVHTLRRICGERRQLVWGFCASFAVYLASILVPNTFTTPDRDGLTAGMGLFVLFGFALMAVIAYAAGRSAARTLGERISRTMLRVGMATFWLAYAATGLAHISGPHRPDMFYGLSLWLMVIALLLRFADCFATKIKAPREIA
jgi:hypothetical protein